MSCPPSCHVFLLPRIRVLRLCLLFQLFPTNVVAARLQARDSGNPSLDDMSTKVWVTLMVLISVFLVLLACFCSKRPILRLFGRYALPAGQTTNARELTADQLTGSNSRNVNNANTTTTTNRRPGRTRRPRRTPSQISTTSLPAYMKDPGDHELVIYRGPMNLQDVSQSDASALPAVDEDQSNSYIQLPDSNSETPLLRQSTSSGDSNGSLRQMPNNNDNLDIRGEAPPYDEAIRATAMESPLQEIDLTDPLPAPASPTVPETQTQRMSAFRSFLNAMSPRLPQGPPNNLRIGHQRTDSSTSNVSSITSASQTRSRLTHHPSPSISSSIFGALSRQRSIEDSLNSPSVISFNSISAPLTHTLIRTDITFPKAGPTPEQIKAITSRDALRRFGVPYGADAVAYAASTSRQDLPPDFESATSTANPFSMLDSSASGASYLVASSGDVTSGSPLRPVSTPETATSAPVEVESYVRTDLDTIPQIPVDALEEATPPSPVREVHAPLNSSPSSPKGTQNTKLSISLPTPSSFHTPLATEFGRNTESRMSSYSVRSYATAQDSSTPTSVYHDTFSTPLSPAETPQTGS